MDEDEEENYFAGEADQERDPTSNTGVQDFWSINILFPIASPAISYFLQFVSHYPRPSASFAW